MNKSLEERFNRKIVKKINPLFFCCLETHKKDIVSFIEKELNSSLAQYKREILEKVIGEDEEGIGINNYHNGINRKQKARNEFRQELRNRLKELEV